ncbi:hypothetical protein [Pontitalea aquivivens]|uniref:hypothetical protein n=1 Tax=Pontitalea aquivivens TaxID=3388663 RepID=UPI003970C015
MKDLVLLPVGLQVALGAGYLAYMIAYAGLRRGHSAVDAVFISFAFGIPALFTFDFLAQVHVALGVAFGAAASIVAGVVWRSGLRCGWGWLMEDLGVHGEDGAATSWDTLIQRRDLKVNQVSVRTKDGRTLFMNERHDYLDGPHKGLILGGDGSVVMVVEEERLPGATGEDRKAQGMRTENGVRLSYIPASEIAQVNMRVL